MKPSEILEKALAKHYCNGDKFREGKSEFMCHAVEEFLSKLEDQGKKTLDLAYSEESVRGMIRLAIDGEYTLHQWMLKNNPVYAKQADYDNQTCYRIKRKFWKDLIEQLKKDGV